ncbi:MAG: peptidase modulator of gyrase [Gemmatimonadetes bacterium]|jgi:predicted Zn-dependent protease|nr:peptidase modulator of gyrase [Gemmatimonadota bacterium]
MSAPRSLFEAGSRTAPPSEMMSRADAQAFLERIVTLSRADTIGVQLQGGYQGNIRFAANRISTSGGVSNSTLVVQSGYGPKHAVVTTSDFSDAGIERAVRQSEAIAKLAPDDPENMPLLPPQQYAEVKSYFDATANLTPAERAAAAHTAIDAAKRAGDLAAAGFIVAGAGYTAIASNTGMFAYFPTTSANYQLTVRTSDGTGSGWAAADHPDWREIDFKAVSDRAIEKARASRNPVAIEPGRYTVILEPQAVGDLVQLLAFALDARSADEGRSAFSRQGGGTKIGERIVDPRVTLFSDPADPQLLGQPWNGEGLPLNREVWIENGALKQLAYSRFWAQKKNARPNGGLGAVKMMGGDTTTEQMIASTPRGILVTRLWYLRQVDPRTVLYTGLTRDGTFLIENGKLTKAVKNMRFNESPLFMLNNLEAIGRAVRVAGTEAGGNVVFPTLKVRDFNFTSLSDAV